MTNESLRRFAGLVGAAALLLAGCTAAPIQVSPSPAAGTSEPPPPGTPASAPTGPPAILPVPEFRTLVTAELDEDTTTATIPVRLPPGTDDYMVAVSCVGVGSVVFDTPGLTRAFDCQEPPGVWTRFNFVPPEAVEFELMVRQDAGVRSIVAVEAYDLQANPDVAFFAPAAWLSDGRRTEAVQGCGLGFKLASGESGVDSCGPSYPVIPPDRAVAAAPGEELTFEFDPAWTITGLTGELARTQDIISDAETARFAHFVQLDGGARRVVFAGPSEPGDWTLRLSASGAREGDNFSVPYYVRVIVGP